MCGIVGYIGNKQALPILLQGLRRLEYRGYDSSGVAVLGGVGIARERSVGRIDALVGKIKNSDLSGSVGMGHTRWATHGGVTEANAHPHMDCTGALSIVHNGIIENYRELRARLNGKHVFTSDTDTEVLAHLIEEHYQSGNLRQAVAKALSHVRGTYGIAVIHFQHPDTLIAARMGSPLVIGLGDGEYYLASDPTPILPYTKRVTFLDDGEIAEITRLEVQTYTLKDEAVAKHVEEIEWNDEQAQKGGFAHYMLKEIFDQPSVVQDAIRGRMNEEEGTAHLGGINMTEEQMRSIERIVLIACGTASYAAMIGKYAFERLTGIPVEVDVSSEFRYRDPILTEKTLVFAISQSGETLDTLAALREAKRQGSIVRGIVNVVGSTIARETDGGTYIHAGPELAVASTKAFTNMVVVLLLYAIEFGRLRRIPVGVGQKLLKELQEIPANMKRILEQNDRIAALANQFSGVKNMLYLARGINFPAALEGSHKLKEISYIHSEAYPAGEMKHGANALLSIECPVLAIMPQNALYEKMWSNLEEAKARNAPLIVVATEGDEQVQTFTHNILWIPPTTALLEPLLATIPLQMFAYHVAVALGRDVDRPRNLAKSVTVE